MSVEPVFDLILALAWKAAITAVIMIAVALVAARSGPVLAAILMGLPISIGPALALLAYTHGDAFVAESARYSLASVFGVIAFMVGYVHGARFVGLWGCLLIGYGAWFAAALVISAQPLSFVAALALAVAGLVLGRIALPRLAPPAPLRAAAPRRFIVIRGVLGGIVVASVVTGAKALGPSLAGYFASFPVVLGSAAWMLASIGNNELAAATLSHADRGMLSFLAFCVTVTLLIEHMSAYGALLVGVTVSILVSAFIVARSGSWVKRPPPAMSSGSE